MVFAADNLDRKKKLLQESYVLIERLKKLRALNADPRMVGMSSRFRRLEGRFSISQRIKK